MSVVIEYVENMPLLLVTGSAPLTAKDAIDVMAAATNVKKQFPGQTVYRVMDFTRGIDFSGMMVCMAAEAGKEGGSNDPAIQTYFVGSSQLVQMGVQALKEQAQYGKAPNVQLFLSLEEAKNLAFQNCGN